MEGQSGPALHGAHLRLLGPRGRLARRQSAHRRRGPRARRRVPRAVRRARSSSRTASPHGTVVPPPALRVPSPSPPGGPSTSGCSPRIDPRPDRPGLIRPGARSPGQLLPNFTSSRVHVGLDEPWDLPDDRFDDYHGGSARCAHCPSSSGREMLVWGDILAEHPESVSALPDGVTVCDWGYEDHSPFEAHVASSKMRADRSGPRRERRHGPRSSAGSPTCAGIARRRSDGPGARGAGDSSSRTGGTSAISSTSRCPIRARLRAAVVGASRPTATWTLPAPSPCTATTIRPRARCRRRRAG